MAASNGLFLAEALSKGNNEVEDTTDGIDAAVGGAEAAVACALGISVVKSLNEVEGLKAPRPSSVADVSFFDASGVGASRDGISNGNGLIH